MTPLYTVAWPIVWVILKLFFFLSVKGKEHMPKKGGSCHLRQSCACIGPGSPCHGSLPPDSFYGEKGIVP